MSKIIKPGGEEADFASPLYVPIKRRSFFMYAGATAGATALLLSGCDDDDDNTPTNMVDVGSGDVGVLNYAYALEQLEAAFYTRVRAGSFYTGTGSTSGSAAEKQILQDLYYHEVIHRDFFKAAITAANATPIKDLEPNFDTIDFTNRVSVLGAAKAFEDLGVAAYNGAGRYIQSATYLGIAGKIVSVEARHAAIIRDLIAEASFVDSDVVAIGSTGLELSKTPAQVVMTANMYLKEGSKLDVSKIG